MFVGDSQLILLLHHLLLWLLCLLDCLADYMFKADDGRLDCCIPSLLLEQL